MNSFPFSRRDFKTRIIRPIHRGRGLQSSVYLVEENGVRFAVKDYAATPPAFHSVAPLLVARECKALQHLDGVPGIPRFLGKIDALAFALEFIEGKPLDLFHRGQVAPVIFENMARVIAAMHARGVAHGDLKRRSNALITPTNEVFLVDFATAIVARGPLSRRLMREVARVDRKAIPRLKKHVAPQLLSARDKWELTHPTPLENWARYWLER